MLAVVSTLSSWPTEAFSVVHPDLSTTGTVPLYSFAGYTPLTYCINADNIHNTASVNAVKTPYFVYQSGATTQATIYELSFIALSATPSFAVKANTVGTYIPYNDNATYISRIFPTSIFNFTGTAGQRQDKLASITLSAGSGYYIIPSHLIYTDVRMPSAITISKYLDIFTNLRKWKFAEFTSSTNEVGLANPSPYNYPFLGYKENYAFLPVYASQVSALSTTIHPPKIYRHAFVGVGTSVDGTTAISNNLLAVAGSNSSLGETILPGSVLFEFSYDSPLYASSEYIIDQIPVSYTYNSTYRESLLTSLSSVRVPILSAGTGYVRDVPQTGINSVSGNLIGRDPIFNEYFVNSALSLVNYQTGEFNLVLNNGFKFSGSALARGYYDSKYDDYTGYPNYQVIGQSVNDQDLSLINPIKTIGNTVFARFDVSVYDLSSIVDKNDYPGFSSLVPTCSVFTYGSARTSIPFNTTSSFSSLINITFSAQNAPMWMYTYTSTISTTNSSLSDWSINGMRLAFNALSAETITSNNSAYITPCIVSNYGNTIMQFAADDAYYGYLQLNCLAAVNDIDGNTESPPLSVYKIEPDGTLIPYNVKLNVFDITHPYRLKRDYNQVYQLEVSAIAAQNAFTRPRGLKMNLRDVAFYYEADAAELYDDNKIALQLYGLNTAIKTTTFDRSVTLINGGARLFINVIQQSIKELASVSRSSIDISDFDTEIFYKLSKTGNYFKNVQTKFDDACRQYISQATNTQSTNEFKEPVEKLCAQLNPILASLAVNNTSNADALNYKLTNELLSIGRLIGEANVSAEEYDLIVNLLTKSFVIAVWPSAYDMPSSLLRGRTSYLPQALNIIKLILTLGVEDVFDYYKKALNDALRHGLIGNVKYDEILKYYADQKFAHFNYEITQLKNQIVYPEITKGSLDPSYSDSNYVSIAYYLASAERELNTLFEYVYALDVDFNDVVFNSLFLRFNLIENGVKYLNVRYSVSNTIINDSTSAIVNPYDSRILTLNPQTHKFTSDLVPLSSKFCVVAPSGIPTELSFSLKMYSQILGSVYDNIETPNTDYQTYIAKNSKLGKELEFRNTPITLYPASSYNTMVLNFYNVSGDDVSDTIRIKALPAISEMLPYGSASACSIIWNVSFLDTDSTYATTNFITVTSISAQGAVPNLSSIPYVTYRELPINTTITEYSLDPTLEPNLFIRKPNSKFIASHNNQQAIHNNEIVINKIGVNPITVSVSVVGNTLSSFGVPNNTLTGSMIYYPDLGQSNTINQITTATNYSTTVFSRLSVMSYDFDIENTLLLRNYFVKNGRVYNPPIYEYTTFNVDSVYGSSLLFKCNANGDNEQEIPIGYKNRNSAYYKVKTIMPKTLNVNAPQKDNLFVQTFHTPACIEPTTQIQLPINYFPSSDIFYSKFNTSIIVSNVITPLGSNEEVNSLVALTATSLPFNLVFTPFSNPLFDHKWLVTSATSASYTIDSNNRLYIQSSSLDGLSAGLATVRLSSVFTYRNGEKASLKSKPLFLCTTTQSSFNNLSAEAWTVFKFDQNGRTAVNTINTFTVNTRLTTVGDGHSEILVLRTLGTPYKSYVWQIGNTKEFVTTSNIASAVIQGIAGTVSSISVTGYYLKLDNTSSINALLSQPTFDDNKAVYINVKSPTNILQNRNNTISTTNSAITADIFKSIEFVNLESPIVSTDPVDLHFYSSSISSTYDANVYTANTKGEYIVDGETSSFITISSIDTGESLVYGPVTVALISGFNDNTITLPVDALSDPDAFNCAVLTISSTDTIRTRITNSNEIFKTNINTRVDSFTAIKLPEFNLFWDDDYYAVGDSLTIKNYSQIGSCFNEANGFGSISVEFNGSTQTIPASAKTIVFSNLDDIGVYSINVSATTVGSLSTEYPLITAKYSRAINVVDKFESYDSTARTTNEQLIFPHTLDRVYVAPNEIAVASNINAAFGKLYDNFEYLLNKARLNDTKLPIEFNKWLGAEVSKGHRWRDVDGESWTTSTPEIATLEFHDIIDVKIYQDCLIVIDRDTSKTNTDSLKLYKLDRLSKNINETNLIGTSDFVGRLSSLTISEEGRVYITDVTNHSVYQYDIDYTTGTITFKSKVGGLGNASRPYRYNTPVDIHSGNGRIYIIDQRNDVVKVYNDKLQYLFNITNGDWVLKNDLVSATTDADGNLYVLRNNGYVYVYDINNNHTNTFVDIFNPFGGEPVKIYSNVIDNGIIYITYQTHVSKITTKGDYLGYFNSLYSPYVEKLKSICQYGRSIYVVDVKAIYKNIDFVSIKSIINDIADELWNREDILMQDNDLIQDWVYNVSINRFKDNFELLRKNIHSKYARNIDATGVVTIQMEAMLTNELPTFDFTQAIIGQNELVFADVINRVIKCLYENLDLLRQTMDTTLSSDMCKNSWCWSWAAMGSVDPIKKNCIINPISFIELRSNSPGVGGRTWEQMTSINNGCCEIVQPSGTKISEIHEGYLALSPDGPIITVGDNSTLLSLYSLSS